MHEKNRYYIGTVQSEQKVASRVAIHKVDNVKSIIEAVYVITCKAIRASPKVCHILLGISYVLPTSKKICQVKKNLSPTIWHNSLAKSRSNLHQEP